MKHSFRLIAAVTVTAAMTSCSGNADKTNVPQIPEVSTLTVEFSPSEVRNNYPATIKGENDADIRPQVSGFITKVHVEEGQQVRKGQTLFTLDQVQFQAAVDAARAAVNAAQTAVNTAQSTADKDKALFEKNIISSYAYQLSQNQLQTAQANLASAKAQLTSAQKNLAYTVVTAPTAGVVGSIPFREGSLASPSMAQPLTTISDNNKVYAYFALNERDILNLTNNGERSLEEAIKAMPKVRLQLANGQDYAYEGTVATVSGVIGSSTGSATARALFDNPSRMLRSGSTGTVSIPQYNDSSIVIPQKATFELQDRKFVLVVNDSNKVASIPVTVQSLSDGQNYVVTSGLRPGEKIVVEGVGTTVRDGMTIKPKSASDQSSDK